MLACLHALFPLLQSQLDSVSLLNKYLLNLLLTTFQLIRAGIALEILYELSPSWWLIFVFHSSGRVIYYFCLLLIISHTQFYFFQSPVLDLAKAAAADCGLVLMIICMNFPFNYMKTFLVCSLLGFQAQGSSWIFNLMHKMYLNMTLFYVQIRYPDCQTGYKTVKPVI